MNHDLTGIKEILDVQKKHMNKIKFHNRISNEKYLREHSEIDFIIKNFMTKILEEKPIHPIQFAGEFFNSTNLKQIFEKEKEKEKQKEKEKEKEKDLK